MRFKLDENLPYRAANTFIGACHDVDTVFDELGHDGVGAGRVRPPT
ncbi:MAG: hypothetical protein ACRDRT_03240 [Pseudonocardiaceae bacterium]